MSGILAIKKLYALEGFEDFGLKINEANLGEYLKQELGGGLEELRSQSIVEAIASPQKYMEKRQEKLNAMYKGPIASAFNQALKEYGDLKLPSHVVEAYAMRHARKEKDQYLELLDIGLPGYEKAVGQHVADRERMENRGEGQINTEINTYDKQRYEGSRNKDYHKARRKHRKHRTA